MLIDVPIILRLRGERIRGDLSRFLKRLARCYNIEAREVGPAQPVAEQRGLPLPQRERHNGQQRVGPRMWRG